MTDAHFGPVQPTERVQLVDVLRGFALFGILQQNWTHDLLSLRLEHVIRFTAGGSFYTTYSFLFGLGFAIQMIRADEARRPFMLRFLWRSFILFLIGAAHYVFIWGGDIVRVYALLAPFLLLVRRWRLSVIVALAAGTLILSMSHPIAEGNLTTRLDPEHLVAAQRAEVARTTLSDADPPAWCVLLPGLTHAYRSRVCERAADLRATITHDMATVHWWQEPGWYPGVVTMFLLGLYAGRKRIIRDPKRHSRVLISVAIAGLVIGVAGNALAVFPAFFRAKGIVFPAAFSAFDLSYLPGNIGLALFYLCAVTLLFTHVPAATRVLAPLANVGRMGLTNYLAQSMVFAVLLGGRDGIGLLAHLGVLDYAQDWYRLLLLNSVFVAQVIWSKWWFGHFRFGPVEWALRSLTWFHLQPMRAPMVAQPTLSPVA